jgi:alpha-galactosidase
MILGAQNLLVLCGLLSAIWQPARAADTVELASLDLSAVEQGWGTPQKDRAVEGHPLSIGGRAFAHGLGTHSPGAIIVALDGGSSRFAGWVGIDDEVGKRGSATFTIIGDGKTLWKSDVLRGGEAAKPFDVDVTRMKTLLLLVGDAGDGFEYDHADWADAHFEVTGASPRTIKAAPAKAPEVAPPPHPTKPQINSPGVVGARTGAPFLFTVPALGARPLKFSAQGLPTGLKLDAATGRITGSIQTSGDYRVTLRVATTDGAATRPLRIVAGDTVALTPPLGWNSYDSYGDDVTEDEILANARYLQEHLQPVGYEYVVVDYRWYDPGASEAPNNTGARAGAQLAADANGRLMPAPNRFPSAADGRGFAALAAKIHAMGLKFGIHIMRGIPKQTVKADLPIQGAPYRATEAANTASVCPWCPDMFGVAADKPAGQAWYDSILRQYADWGVDLIKVDDMSSPYSADEIAAVRNAIEKCGRAIVFSLSPGETPLSNADHVQTHANMWRISGDFWDDWRALDHAFDLLAAWHGHGGPGHWPDADMIPLGHLSVHNRSVGPDRHTRFTPNEQVTLMSLWSLAPSPQMLGMNLPDNDPFTEALLTNEEAVAINQDALGRQARRVELPDLPAGAEVWIRELADGAHAVGLFNRLGIEQTVAIPLSALGLTTPQTVRDIWQRKDLGAQDRCEATLAPHGARLLRLQSAR